MNTRESLVLTERGTCHIFMCRSIHTRFSLRAFAQVLQSSQVPRNFGISWDDLHKAAELLFVIID
jgi:hypothetical protein